MKTNTKFNGNIILFGIFIIFMSIYPLFSSETTLFLASKSQVRSVADERANFEFYLKNSYEPIYSTNFKVTISSQNRFKSNFWLAKFRDFLYKIFTPLAIIFIIFGLERNDLGKVKDAVFWFRFSLLFSIIAYIFVLLDINILKYSFYRDVFSAIPFADRYTGIESLIYTSTPLFFVATSVILDISVRMAARKKEVSLT